MTVNIGEFNRFKLQKRYIIVTYIQIVLAFFSLSIQSCSYKYEYVDKLTETPQEKCISFLNNYKTIESTAAKISYIILIANITLGMDFKGTSTPIIQRKP